MLKIEADRFQNLEYGESEFKTEARAVLGEYNKNSANPISKLYEVTRDKAFDVHTYKHTTMGFLKDIEDMPNQYAYSKTFFDRWYRPEHTTVIVAGDVDPAKAIRLVEKYWGGWKRGVARRRRSRRSRPRRAPSRRTCPWPSDTLPWVVVAFHGPAFSETKKDLPALDALFDLSFGPTSDLYKKLVEKEQKVDSLQPSVDINEDPELVGVFARLKKGTDAVYVRDEILATLAALRDAPVDAKRLAEVKSNARYGLVRGLDDTERIAGLLARFVRLRRSYGTLNEYLPAHRRAHAGRPPGRREDVPDRREPRPHDALEGADARSDGDARRRSRRYAPPRRAAAGPDVAWIAQKSPLPRLEVKLLFAAGSAHDPAGKEGLAALTARMIADAGSQDLRIDEIRKALFPVAAQLRRRIDKEMTIFTGVVHRDAWKTFADVALPQLVAPGFREEDFRRIKDAQKNALVQNLREQQRRGARQGAPPDAHLRGHAVRPPDARDRRGTRRDHARRREGRSRRRPTRAPR